jgi:hypothetical protein
MNAKLVKVTQNWTLYSIQWDVDSQNSALNKKRINAISVPPTFTRIMA